MITTSRLEKAYIEALATSIGARRIVEIGVFKGQTTAVLSQVAARHGGYVVAVDPMQWASRPASLGELIDGWLHPKSYEAEFWANLDRVGATNVVLRRALSTDPELLADPDARLRELDLVFIDGEHTYDAALADIAAWGSRVREGGLILMHDVRPRFAGVLKLFGELAADPKFSPIWPRWGSVGTLRVQRRFAADELTFVRERPSALAAE